MFMIVLTAESLSYLLFYLLISNLTYNLACRRIPSMVIFTKVCIKLLEIITASSFPEKEIRKYPKDGVSGRAGVPHEGLIEKVLHVPSTMHHLNRNGKSGDRDGILSESS